MLQGEWLESGREGGAMAELRVLGGAGVGKSIKRVISAARRRYLRNDTTAWYRRRGG